MLRYYDVQKNWRKVKPFIQSAEAARIIKENFFRFDDSGRPFDMYLDGPTLPVDHEDVLWRTRSGPRPKFWDYVCIGGCHWLAYLNFFLAKKVEPKRAWRIVSSTQHSTVWDGGELLFDMNFLARGVPPEEWLRMAQQDKSEEEMVAEEMALNPYKRDDPSRVRQQVRDYLAFYRTAKPGVEASA